VLAIVAPSVVAAHAPVRACQAALLEGSFSDVAWLGAEHMLTGYDHLLFLLGVLFFLTRPIQVVSFITAFTIGHTIVLLTATPLGIRADPYLIDAVDRADRHLQGVRESRRVPQVLGMAPPPLLPVVFLFGLIHGFGLSTRLQEMALARDPDLFEKIVAFNIGVELGQVAALAAMGAALLLWRETSAWRTFSRGANGALIAAGAVLFAVQIQGFAQQQTASVPTSGNI
jgi:hypothetical protein